MTSAYVYRAIMVSLSNHDCVGRGEPDFRIALGLLAARLDNRRVIVYSCCVNDYRAVLAASERPHKLE